MSRGSAGRPLRTGPRTRSCSASSMAAKSSDHRGERHMSAATRTPVRTLPTLPTSPTSPTSPADGPAETRIASYLLTEYLERIGVEVVFGLCGHTIIAFLDALGKSRTIRFVTTRHEQV